MPFAPQQNWARYEELTAEPDRRHARQLTDEQKFALYEDMFRLVCCPRYTSAENNVFQQQRWEEKLALRQKLNSIFRAADQRRRG